MSPTIRRRYFLAATATTAVASVAGCSSDDAATESSTDAANSGSSSVPSYSITGAEDIGYGDTSRIRVSVGLADSVTPSQSAVQTIAEDVVSSRDADEIYVEIYSPGVASGDGACGSAHWVNGNGFEDVSVNSVFCERSGSTSY